MALPEEFLARMRSMLGEDFERFKDALSGPNYRALRRNLIKTESVLSLKKLTFLGEKTAFCDDAFYIPCDEKGVGNHPLHHAGAFYMQEPSATAVVEALGVDEGDIVLDLCAAPGGKSTQAASKLNGAGLLVSNEFVSSRVKPLLSNIERMGIVNAVVLSLRPDIIAEKCPETFDKIIVDAPCSGEGMFRKESAAIENWSVENVKACADRQLKILESAAKMLKKGGKMVYSTCTYSAEENEGVIEKFLRSHNDFHLVKPLKDFGEPAFGKFAPSVENIEFARRIFNFNGGEGHFVAVMQRDGDDDSVILTLEPDVYDNKSNDLKIFAEFFKENFYGDVPRNAISHNGFVYIIPADISKLGLKPVSCGILAGVVKGNRFAPEHSMFNNMKYKPKSVLRLMSDGEKVQKFLHGEEIDCDSTLKGYVQVLCDGVPLGYGKASNGTLKNHYPKGLRTL
ncbi:MAG: hypothetical protein E7525_03195 [Ruminococcaceae bacterium]|nr:hypothetical protein [Oscillospiraceae bacterium]